MKIGAAQLLLYPELEKNLRNISGWIKTASEQDVDIVNFPEASLTGYVYESFSQIKQEDIERSIDQLSRLTQDLGISAVIGTPYWIGDRLFNSVIVLLGDGRRYLYHKSNLVSSEEKYFSPGEDLLTFELGKFKFGTIICRDQSFPDLARRIKLSGAHVLFISCAHFYWPNEARLKVEKNRALPIARASENSLFVCKANAVGTHRGRINLGHSMIVGPNGVVIGEAGETQEELLTFEIHSLADWSR